jgi:hypothetical protein
LRAARLGRLGGAARDWVWQDWSGEIEMGKEEEALLLYSGGRRSGSEPLAAINALHRLRKLGAINVA